MSMGSCKTSAVESACVSGGLTASVEESMKQLFIFKMNEGLIYNLCSVHALISIFLLFFIAPQDILSWDLAVVDETGLNFFDLNGTSQLDFDEISYLDDFYTVTYDFSNERIFFNARDHDENIFALDLRKRKLTPLVPKRKHLTLGMSYDTVSETLFWTDGHAIWKQSLHNDSSFPETLLTFTKDLPTGIGISVCKRLLFWTNINHLSASIDRSHLDGSNHTKIIVEDIFVPLAIAVDEIHQKLYWTDDKSGIYFRIESSNFDGTERKSVIHGTNQEPIGIVALNNAIYWTDTMQKNIWMHSMNSFKSEPEIFHEFHRVTPYGIVAFHQKHFECTNVPPSDLVQYDRPEVVLKNISQDSFCLNLGTWTERGCLCKLGFSGYHCEISNCHNFCLNEGKCYLNGIGLSQCLCPEGYSGDRCQENLCLGYCLNGGTCFVNNSIPLCLCKAKFLGTRCETFKSFNYNQTTSENSLANVMCSFNSTSPKNADPLQIDPILKSSRCSNSELQSIIIIGLVCMETLTMLVVVILARMVCVLRRRPRIKKRIIINKGVKSQTPMTARPHMGPSEQCEITIENCCNMNICETPCFEPNLRSTKISTKLLPKKTEDKKNLLKNMEGDFENTDVLYS